jgi:hypothetical protein
MRDCKYKSGGGGSQQGEDWSFFFHITDGTAPKKYDLMMILLAGAHMPGSLSRIQEECYKKRKVFRECARTFICVIRLGRICLYANIYHHIFMLLNTYNISRANILHCLSP